MNIPEEIIDKIRSAAKKEWPDDKEMQVYTVKNELDAYREFLNLDFSGFSDQEKSELISAAQEIFDSWEEIVDSIKDEMDALRELRNFSNDKVDPDLIERWKVEAKENSEGCYREQLDFIKGRVEKYLNIIATRKAIDPIKKLLIELESIVGNECYNGNIQNYGSWGELESIGRAFRYPVRFYKDEGEYKMWKVDESIPSEELITGYYAFGANELNIFRALHKILKYLEENYGLELPKS